uniref:Uncharacterized protein n=1 Tax=Oryza nivara TaxID=4536 RepID=A0A0E0FJ13_ORYNI
MALVAAAAANQKQQKASIGRRAWRLLCLAVLWARKGSAVGHGARGDVTILPTLVINNVQYRDLFCYDYNGEPSECGGVEDESFRDGAMDEQLLELSMPTPASARRSAR